MSYQLNLEIQNNKLYGELKENDIVKKYVTEEIINAHLSGNYITISGEEHLSVQKMSFGGIIITTEKIGQEYCDKYNVNQMKYIKNKTFAHKSLCDRNEEATGLLFITIDDLVENENYKEIPNKDLCNLVKKNIQKIVEDKLQWIIDYSKHIIKDYYSLPPNRLKIKPNFIFDDGVYEDESGIKGGLLINGLLQELEFYNNEWSYCMQDKIGMLCQVLSPSGLPRNKKWCQIDIGLSFIGKRNYKENMLNALVRQAELDISAVVHPDVIKESMLIDKLYYGSLPEGKGYEGYEIYIWEILYQDQLTFKCVNKNEKKNVFCKCKERNDLINSHKEKIYRYKRES